MLMPSFLAAWVRLPLQRSKTSRIWRFSSSARDRTSSMAEEAGAVFVIVNHLDGSLHLLGPAPGPTVDDDGERRWIVEAAPPASQAEIDAILGKRRRADPDLWIVEIEDRHGLAGLAAAPA